MKFRLIVIYLDGLCNGWKVMQSGEVNTMAEALAWKREVEKRPGLYPEIEVINAEV